MQNKITKIVPTIYNCIAHDITTNEVIITDIQIKHIQERHPNDYEKYSIYLKEIIQHPDYIIETPKPNTALIIKEFPPENLIFKTILRLATSHDNPNYKNSIITFMKIDEREKNRLLKNKKILYKRE